MDASGTGLNAGKGKGGWNKIRHAVQTTSAIKASTGRRFTMTSRPELFPQSSPVEESPEETEQKRQALASMFRKINDMSIHIGDLEDKKLREDEVQYTRDDDESSVATSEAGLSPAMLRQFRMMKELGSSPSMCGNLMKKSSGSTHRWVKRYFVLQGSTLMYYNKMTDKKPKRLINIKGARVARIQGATHKNKKVANGFEFALYCPHDRAYSFVAETEIDRSQWIESINKAAGSTAVPTMPTIPSVSLNEVAQNCTAFGSGLFGGPAGERLFFTIQVSNPRGSKFKIEDSSFDIQMENEYFHYDLKAEQEEKDTFIVSYNAPRPGIYTISIQLGELDVYGSPFTCEIVPGPASWRDCELLGQGLTAVYLGQPASFMIVSKDQYECQRNEGGDAFKVAIFGPGQVLEFSDNEDGTYNCVYNAFGVRELQATLPPDIVDDILSEPLRVEVTLHNKQLPGSPFSPDIFTSNEHHIQNATFSHGSPPREHSTLTSMPSYSAVRTKVLSNPDFEDAHYGRDSMNSFDQSFSSKSFHEPIQSYETETVFIEQVHVPSEPISSQSAQVPEFHNDFPVNRSLPPSTHNVDTLRNPHMGESDKLELRRKAVEEQFHRLQDMRRRLDEDRLLFEPSSDKYRIQSDTERLAVQAQHLHEMGDHPETHVNTYYSSISSHDDESTPVISELDLSETRKELRTPAVQSIFNRHRSQLEQVFEAYSFNARPMGMSIFHFAQLLCDFEVCPTFVTLSDLQYLFRSFIPNSSRSKLPTLTQDNMGLLPPTAQELLLDFPSFCDLLGTLALYALSRPAFQQLYPTPSSKVSVVIEMWGLADVSKLETRNQQSDPHFGMQSQLSVSWSRV